jgi:hypothetical protein
VKLNLACGDRAREGYTGVDIVKTTHTDVQHDLLTFPWPFESDSADAVYCSHFVEHIPMGETPSLSWVEDGWAHHSPGKDLFFAFFDEMWRVMKVGAEATIIVPYGASDRAFQDPTHRRFIVPATFVYLNAGWRREQGIAHYNVECDFALHIDRVDADEFTLRSDDFKTFARSHYWNSVLDMQATLTKLAPKEITTNV